ncbi:MAG: phosphatase PAP2 family protein [Cyclobacteriaceae bacterium]|nr:phosphatase PAP2 family protein [Cyclobacteriaceae bacterium]
MSRLVKNNVSSVWRIATILIVIACLMFLVQLLPQLDFIAWLQSEGTSTTTRFLQIVSDSITFFSLGVPLAIAIFKEFDKNPSKKNSRLSFVYVGVSIGVAGLISYAIKHTGMIPRPYEVDARIIQLSVGGGFSFPSGHTTEAFASATALSLLLSKPKYFLPFFCWASLVGFSRIYLGVHYPFDVLGGIAIGVTASCCLKFYFQKKTEIFNTQ